MITHYFSKKNLGSIVLLVALYINPLAAQASTLTAVAFELRPWGERVNSSPSGIIPEYIKALEEKSKIDIDLKLVPYGRMISMLKNGNADFAIFYKTESLNGITPFKFINSQKNIVVARGNLNSYSSLEGLNIGVGLNILLNDQFDQDETLRKRSAKDYERVSKMFQSNRVDAIAGNETVIYSELGRLGFNINQLGKPFVLGEKEIWLQVSDKSKRKDQIDALMPSLEEMVNKKEFESLIDKHFK